MKTRAENLLESLDTVAGDSLNEGIFGRPEQREIDKLSNEIRIQLKEALKKDKENFVTLVAEYQLVPEGSILEVFGSEYLIDSFVEKTLRMSSLGHVRDFHDKCVFLFG
jgi:hypothetical protein